MPLIPSLRMRGRYHLGLQKEFKVSLGYKVSPCLVRVSATTTASSVTISRKQEGSSVQLLGVWPWVVHFRHLSTAQFGKIFLMIINSVLCAQLSLRCDYVETLCKAYVTSSMKMASLDWQGHWQKIQYGHTDSEKCHQCINHVHSQPHRQMTGYAFFSLKEQPCVFTIFGPPSAYLWTQGPLYVPYCLKKRLIFILCVRIFCLYACALCMCLVPKEDVGFPGTGVTDS